MNCVDFNDQLHEYVDGALDGDVQAAAQEHLRQCADCRRSFLREEALAKSIRRSFGRATAGISLRSETKRNILQRLESRVAPSNAWMGALERFISSPVRRIVAGTALVGFLLLLLGIQFQRRGAEDSAPRAMAQARRDFCVVDVPIQTQTHIFRLENNMILDTVVPSVTVGYAHFSGTSEQPSKPL